MKIVDNLIFLSNEVGLTIYVFSAMDTSDVLLKLFHKSMGESPAEGFSCPGEPFVDRIGFVLSEIGIYFVRFDPKSHILLVTMIVFAPMFWFRKHNPFHIPLNVNKKGNRKIQHICYRLKT